MNRGQRSAFDHLAWLVNGSICIHLLNTIWQFALWLVVSIRQQRELELASFANVLNN
tara:strand:- start:55 stop:225 length:171 start_codon:yes stop_codon:yes gene_type:complete